MLQYILSLLRTKAHEISCPQKHSSGCSCLTTYEHVSPKQLIHLKADAVPSMPGEIDDWPSNKVALREAASLKTRSTGLYCFVLRSPFGGRDVEVPQPHRGFVPVEGIAIALFL